MYCIVYCELIVMNSSGFGIGLHGHGLVGGGAVNLPADELV